MKHCIFNIISAVLLMAALQGCSVSDSFSDYVATVTTARTENSLRMELRIDFRKDCQYFVEYWKTEDKSTLRRSEPIRATAGEQSICTVMFLYPQTEYSCVIVADGLKSKTISFKTGSLPMDIPEYKVEQSDGTTRLEGLLMQWEGGNPGYVTLCDWDGNVVWYHAFGKAIRTAWYDPDTRSIAVLAGFKAGDGILTSDPFYRLASDIIVSDLCGNTLFSRKATESFIPYPHHEFKILEGGNLLILHNVVKDGIYGEGFSIVSPEGKILWNWDSFDEINPGNTDYIDAEKFATDYIHANSVDKDCNGDYYFTVNRLSELWKIDGTTGEVLYRLGPHGDVACDFDLPSGGLHAASAIAPDLVLCYDNGSNRGFSKGVLYRIDPVSKTATVDFEIVLPAALSSSNRSNTQLIGSDVVLLSSTTSGKAVFTDRSGKVLRVISRSGISYRAYWLDI